MARRAHFWSWWGRPRGKASRKNNLDSNQISSRRNGDAEICAEKKQGEESQRIRVNWRSRLAVGFENAERAEERSPGRGSVSQGETVKLFLRAR